jgi:hypothetical protein
MRVVLGKRAARATPRLCKQRARTPLQAVCAAIDAKHSGGDRSVATINAVGIHVPRYLL